MNKNTKTFISVAVICSAILILSIVGIGFTLAKYVKTSNKLPEEASVAKFGVTMSWAGDAFATEYAADDTTSLTSAQLSVKSSASGKKIAPGTTGKITLTLAGTSEVAFNLTINLTETYSEDWDTADNGGVYHPIILSATTTISGAQVAPGTTNLTVDSDNKIAVKNFAAGETISGVVEITWSWPFESNDAADNNMYNTNATYALSALATATQIN